MADDTGYTTCAEKRLLVLGSTNISYDIIEIAKKLGAYTIVADSLIDSSGKRIADKSYEIDISDLDALVEISKVEKVDCVLAGASDYNTEKALSISEILDLPFYATREQWDVLSNKRKFKEMCRKFGISTVDEFALGEGFKDSNLEIIEYPVIVKPVDSFGGNGISVCTNENELREGYEKALSFSVSKEIVVEKYMTGHEVTAFYTIQDGYVSLSAMSDRYLVRQEGLTPMSSYALYPSMYLNDFLNGDDVNFRHMFRQLEIKNAFFSVQGFFNNGSFISFEMNFRFLGTKIYRVLFAENGINPLDMFIRFSLSGDKMTGGEVKHSDNPNFRRCYGRFIPILKPGKIKKIIGVDDISKELGFVDIQQKHFEGDVILDDMIGTTRQQLFVLFLVANDREKALSMMKNIQNKIFVISDTDENMLIYPDV